MQWLQDILYGWRVARRSVGFTCVAVLSLAAGIGLSSAIFSVANALLYRPLPGANTADIVRVFTSSAS